MLPDFLVRSEEVQATSCELSALLVDNLQCPSIQAISTPPVPVGLVHPWPRPVSLEMAFNPFISILLVGKPRQWNAGGSHLRARDYKQVG